MKTILVLLLFLCTFGCVRKQQASTAVIPEDTFVQFYADLLIAGESGNLRAGDTTSKKFIDSLYTHYGITDAQVRLTMEHYNKDLHRWKDFYDRVIRQLEARQKDQQDKKRS